MTRPVLEIAQREFLENVLSWRFALALALSTLLLATSVVALGTTFQEDREAYRVAQENAEEEGRASGFGGGTNLFTEIQRVLTRPNPLSIFLGGPGDDFARASSNNLGFARDATGGSSSPTNVRFSPLDFGFVATVVMTFMAVMFSFDAISGERERGTLKLLLSNPVPKDAVLLGKYLGALASLLVPFAVSVVIGLAALQVLGVSLQGEEWLRLGLVLLLVVPLVSVFTLAGLWVSSLTRRSSTSLLAMLLVWLVLVFGAGNVAAVAAKGGADTTTGAEVLEQFQAISQEERDRFAAINAEMNTLFEVRQRNNGTLPPEDQARYDALLEEQQGVFQESQDERERLLNAVRRQLDDQLALAETIAMVSPTEAFRSLASAVARSDYWSFKHAFEASETYRREATRAQEEWSAAQGGDDGVYIGGGGGPVLIRRTVSLGGTMEPQAQFEWPTFHYEPPTVASQLAQGSGLLGLLVLLGTNVLAFAGAYVAFLRYDVR